MPVLRSTPPDLAAAITQALQRARDGEGFKEVLEKLLLELTHESADAFALLLDAGRGAFTPLLEANGGRALFIGDACSGTPVALGHLGFNVLRADTCALRLAFANLRDASLDHAGQSLLTGIDPRLPFADDSFDLVVQEEGLPHPALGWGHGMEELWRVCRGELWVSADNRLAYKRSTGMRGQHKKAGVLGWLGAALFPRSGERTWAGTRSALQTDGVALRSYALYPHSRDFSHVVALDAELPRLTVGPMERKNRLKTLAAGVGLFPWLTPSFAIHGSRGKGGSQRLDRILAAIAERIDEPTPEVEHVVSTRSNNCLVQTRPHGAGPQDRSQLESTPVGYWILHIPTNPSTERMLRNDADFLRHIRKEHPKLPIPEPLVADRIEGLFLHCERRLSGLTAPQLTGERAIEENLLMGVALDFAELVVEPDALIDEARFAELVSPRFQLARRLCGHGGTADALQAMHEDARACLVGRRLPLVLYHADLRPKHLQIRPDGNVLAYLDWGASERCFLPYLDLLHLVVHLSKGHSPDAAAACARVRVGRWLPHERAALDLYSERLGLQDEVRACLERTLPGFMAGMSERNWDYSRPQWVRRQFGLA
jgi:SAM-dependent methyltransferase